VEVVSSFFTDVLTDCNIQVICRVRIWIPVKTTNTVTDIPKEWVCENATRKYALIAIHWFRIFLILAIRKYSLIASHWFWIFLILTKLEYSKHPAG
jgi:hypothetical protein